MQKVILVVEDSRLFCGLISKRIVQEFPYECIIKNTCAEALTFLEQRSADVLLAVLDLNLPDAPDGEIVELVVARKIPTIVVTGRVDDVIRDRILHLQVFDYIIKGPHTLDLLTSGIRRLLRNYRYPILVVDDSPIARGVTAKLLSAQYFPIVEAGDGVEALQKLKEDPSIRLILTDFHMPRMDGFELISSVRARYPMNTLAIIGLSARGNSLLSSQFLKRGANDFLSKPYFEEELIWRVNQNIEMLEFLETERSQQGKLEQQIDEQTALIKESQAMVIQQEKLAAIGQLAAGVAHEINNPLGFIASNLNSLKNYVSKNETYLAALEELSKSMPEAQRSELQAIYQKQKIDLVREDLPDLINDCLDGTERMKKIVLGLKGFARKDDGGQELADINQCLEEALTISWNELKYKAAVNRNFSPLPQTLCCPQQLAQVFIILLINAAHAITEKGLIDVSSHYNEDCIHVDIQDTGCGIPPEHLSKIFEPFFTTKARDKGTGLGMGIARDIVSRHKGTISVESTPGQGSCFSLSFPVLQNITIET